MAPALTTPSTDPLHAIKTCHEYHDLFLLRNFDISFRDPDTPCLQNPTPLLECRACRPPDPIPACTRPPGRVPALMSPTNVPATAAPNAAASQQQPPQPPTRRVLGDVSPNVRAIASPAVFDHKRIMAGSPLKRTAFSASMEDGVGFTYLKKRKLSDGMPLSQMGSSAALSSAPQPNFVTQNALQMAAGNETVRTWAGHCCNIEE